MTRNRVKFGLTLPNRGVVIGATTVAEMLQLAVEAESAGWDSVWVGDSIFAKPRLDAMVLLGAIAARTTRVRIGPACFASTPLRNALLLAYQWASLDFLSGGRTIFVACQGQAEPGGGAFLYVTDECNLRCAQCYYKPWLKKAHAEMPSVVAIALLQKFRELGAVKVSFLGGEPTLYGQAEGNKPLGYLVHAAREMGFEYTRLVTNGTFDTKILKEDHLKEIDEITFSIDGDTPEIHNKLRGRQSYERAVSALQVAVSIGYTVHITMCVHRGNVGRTEDGMLILSRAIKWAETMGARSFNLHPLFRMGVARDSWTGETDIDPLAWPLLYREIQSSIRRGDYNVPVRMPMRFVTTDDFRLQSTRYGYCSVKLADRLDVHPNGQMHICALHSGTPVSVATFETEGEELRITWTATDNELYAYPFDDAENRPCPIMRGFPEILEPLCISFKPGQDEFVWKRMGLA